MFEVQDLHFATLATVSWCGMVWFSEDVLSLDMIFEHFLTRMRNISIDEGEKEVRGRLQIGKGAARSSTSKDDTVSPTLQVMKSLYMYICTLHVPLNCLQCCDDNSLPSCYLTH